LPAAAVVKAGAEVEQARLNLGYTTIYSPVNGFSSYARVQEGAYVNLQNSLLTYVVQADPIWVNFSVSENDMLKYRGQTEQGQLRVPRNGAYEVEVVLGDGSVFPQRGRITFADAEYNPQTGTFLVRATLPNPGAVLRPGQFVRVHLRGAVRPRAIVVPQRTVQQGAKGHFVWAVTKDGKAEPRPVTVGDWIGNDWFITSGLQAGDKVVVEGGMALRPGEPVRVKARAKTVSPPRADGADKTEERGLPPRTD
jgi:membrane fusion protein (multidrug efflux system)